MATRGVPLTDGRWSYHDTEDPGSRNSLNVWGFIGLATYGVEERQTWHETYGGPPAKRPLASFWVSGDRPVAA